MEIDKLQQKCEHLDKTYHPDPNGNGDSEYICNTCGKAAKRL